MVSNEIKNDIQVSERDKNHHMHQSPKGHLLERRYRNDFYIAPLLNMDTLGLS